MTSLSSKKLVGVNLKMYFDRARTLAWAEELAFNSTKNKEFPGSGIELFVFPTFPLISEVSNIFNGTQISYGAQNVALTGSGPFTGEVSASVLKEYGCKYVILGHHERRSIFKEGEEIIAAKVQIVFEAGLIPLICVGETSRADQSVANSEVISQVTTALRLSSKYITNSPFIIAYEPTWAIGAAEPAPSKHILDICSVIRGELEKIGATAGKLIYGGSAGPGLFQEISAACDGIFLGRKAHKVSALLEVLREVSCA